MDTHKKDLKCYEVTIANDLLSDIIIIIIINNNKKNILLFIIIIVIINNWRLNDYMDEWMEDTDGFDCT